MTACDSHESSNAGSWSRVRPRSAGTVLVGSDQHQLWPGRRPTLSARDIDAQIERHYARVEALYKDIHANPELAFEEVNTAKKLAKELRELGFEVTEGVGKTGVVGMLRNGPGPTILVRTELDALPMEEKTGLPYASKVKTTYLGKETPGRAQLRPRPAHGELGWHGQDAGRR